MQGHNRQVALHQMYVRGGGFHHPHLTVEPRLPETLCSGRFVKSQWWTSNQKLGVVVPLYTICLQYTIIILFLLLFSGDEAVPVCSFDRFGQSWWSDAARLHPLLCDRGHYHHSVWGVCGHWVSGQRVSVCMRVYVTTMNICLYCGCSFIGCANIFCSSYEPVVPGNIHSHIEDLGQEVPIEWVTWPVLCFHMTRVVSHDQYSVVTWPG